MRMSFLRVWPSKRQFEDFMIITTHQFTKVENPELVMSSKAAARAEANKDEWNEFFGSNITSVVPIVGDLGPGITVNVWDQIPYIPEQSKLVLDMVKEALDKKTKVEDIPSTTTTRKKDLSEVLRSTKPQTKTDLMLYLNSGRHSLTSKPLVKCPGYVTAINTAKEVQKEPYSLNHYRIKGELPEKPLSNGDSSGTARFDESWFTNGIPSYATVLSAVQFGNLWFLVIDGTYLPVVSPGYPLAGGFYTGALTPSLHSKHNYQVDVLPNKDSS